jgi:competence protein ComFB
MSERELTTDGKTMEGLVLINILEEVMRVEAPKIMKQFGMCTCDRCVTDVLAIALNNIQPKYVVTQKGALFAKIESYGNQYKTDILAKLTQACDIVGQSPSHH